MCKYEVWSFQWRPFNDTSMSKLVNILRCSHRLSCVYVHTHVHVLLSDVVIDIDVLWPLLVLRVCVLLTYLIPCLVTHTRLSVLSHVTSTFFLLLLELLDYTSLEVHVTTYCFRSTNWWKTLFFISLVPFFFCVYLDEWKCLFIFCTFYLLFFLDNGYPSPGPLYHTFPTFSLL